MTDYTQVLKDRVAELEAQVYNDGLTLIFQEDEIEELEMKVELKDELIVNLALKLVESNDKLHDQVTKTCSIESKYLDLVQQLELHHLEAKQLVRQLECLHHDVVKEGLYQIEKGVSTLRSDLEEGMK